MQRLYEHSCTYLLIPLHKPGWLFIVGNYSLTVCAVVGTAILKQPTFSYTTCSCLCVQHTFFLAYTHACTHVHMHTHYTSELRTHAPDVVPSSMKHPLQCPPYSRNTDIVGLNQIDGVLWLLWHCETKSLSMRLTLLLLGWHQFVVY